MGLSDPFALLLVLPALFGCWIALAGFRVLRPHGIVLALGFALSVGVLVAGITMNLQVLIIHGVTQ